MRKIRLSDTDIEFFDLEISPFEYSYFQKHKDAFRCMWKDQGKPFWTKFTITFRSFTVKHGVIKQMSCDTPKFEDFVDQAFIYIHEQFVDGKEATARGFIDDTAKLAQNHDKFSQLDSKSFTKDPFYLKDTREFFRRFFGEPDHKSSYVKVYILSPIYLRFGGSVCRCLKKWMDAPPQDCQDDSYWIPPSPQHKVEDDNPTRVPVLMCTNCLDDCGTRYFKERICGQTNGPKFLDYWKLGDPRFNDPSNPLYNKKAERDSDWRDRLSPEDFRDFIHYAKFKYGTDDEKCKDCLSLDDKDQGFVTNVNQKRDNDKKKKKKKKKGKEEIAREKRKDDVEEEVQRIIDHITGKRPQEDMPPILRVRTENSATPKYSDPVISPFAFDTHVDTDKKNPTTQLPASPKHKKPLFGTKTKRTDDIRFGILEMDECSKANVVGGFKVVKLEDELSGAKEITIALSAVDGLTRGTEKKDTKKLEDPWTNQIPLSVELIKSKVENLPDKMEWWEGNGWCACVVNYEVEEKPTGDGSYSNFTIKITGNNEESIKRIMFKLLIYVSKRKKRPCPGWMMDDNDVVAGVFPEEIPQECSIVVTLQQGFRFEERLSEEERKTKSRGQSSIFRNNNVDGPMCFYVQPKDNDQENEQVLMALDGGVANAVAKGDKGPMNFKLLLTRISGHCIDAEVGYGTPNYPRKLKETKKSLQLNLDPYQFEIEKTPMWDQILLSPRTFELLFMVNTDRVQELKNLGLRIVDLENIPGKGREKQPPFQSFCKVCRKDVFDCTCIDKTKFKDPVTCCCQLCTKPDTQNRNGSSTKAAPTQTKATPTQTKAMPTQTKVTPTQTKATPTQTKATPTQTKATPTQTKAALVKTKAMPTSSQTKAAATQTTPTKTTPTQTKATPTSTNNPPIELLGDYTITDVTRDRNARPEPITKDELEKGFDLVEFNLKESRKENAKKMGNDDKKDSKVFMPPGKKTSASPQNCQVKGDMEGLFKFTAVRNQTGPTSNAPVNVIVENLSSPDKFSSNKDETRKLSEEAKIAKRKEIEDRIAAVRRYEKMEEEKRQKVTERERKKQEKKEIPSYESMIPHTAIIIDIQKDRDVLSTFKFKPQDLLSKTPKHDTKVNKSGTKSPSNGNRASDEVIEQAILGLMNDKVCAGDGSKNSTDREKVDAIAKHLIHAQMESQARAKEAKEAKEPKEAKATLNLRKCASCQKVEPSLKTYKKCLKCKEKKVKNARYYCDKDCQTNDWTLKHKREHKDGSLE